MKFTIEIFEVYGGEHWAQAHYLVRGYDDVLWTSDIEDAVQFLRQELAKYEVHGC